MDDRDLLSRNNIPFYPSEADYTTNSPSYYENLGRKTKLIQLLAEKIWDYDDEIKEYFKRWEDNLGNINEDVIEMMIQWLEDGTLEEIINENVFGELNRRLNLLDQLVVNVKDEQFNVKGDGETDDTNGFQTAINFLDTLGGGTLYIPNGTYILTAIDLPSNIHLKGQSKKVQLKHKKSFTGRWANPNYPPSTYPKKVDAMFIANGNDIIPAYNTKNIHVSDITFIGNSVTDGFFETLNLLCFYSTDNIVIERCDFFSPQGDAILVASNHIESHSKNITIRDCNFDGVNYLNRQAISIMDGDRITIEDNYFTRLTTTGMPGAIDIESNNDSWAIARHVTIKNNRFVKIGVGGSKPAIIFVIDYFNNVVKNQDKITIKDNYFEECVGVRIQGRVNPTKDSKPNNIVIEDNHGLNLQKFVIIAKAKGVHINRNTINGTTYGSDLGSFSSDNSEINRDIYFENNTIKNDSSEAGYGVVVRSGENIVFKNNLFTNSGLSTGGRGYVLYLTGNVSRLTIDENTFETTGSTTHAIFKSELFTTTTKNENSFYNNKADNGINLGIIPTIRGNGNIYFSSGENRVFDSTSSPNDFPVGETIFYTSEDSGLPSTNKAGILKVIKTGGFSLTETTSIIQIYYPNASEDRKIYTRNAVNGGESWVSWTEHSGSAH